MSNKNKMSNIDKKEILDYFLRFLCRKTSIPTASQSNKTLEASLEEKIAKALREAKVQWEEEKKQELELQMNKITRFRKI